MSDASQDSRNRTPVRWLAILSVTVPGIAFSQLVRTEWNVELPPSLPVGRMQTVEPSATAPIDFKLLTFKAIPLDVTLPSPMRGLPPVSGRINVTVSQVEDPRLPDPVQTVARGPVDPAAAARFEEWRANQPLRSMAFLSARVHEGGRTLLRIHPNGRVDQAVTAWSNVDFNHVRKFSSYRIIHAVSGTIEQVDLMMMVTEYSSEAMRRMAARAGREYQPPEIPQLPELARNGPAFVMVSGDPTGPAVDTLEQIHDLYRKEGPRMEAAHVAQRAAQAARKAELMADPPQPKDVNIHFWKRERPLRRPGSNTADSNEGGAQ